MRIRTLATCLLLVATACTGELTDDPTDPDGSGSGSGSSSGSGSGSGSNNDKGDFNVVVDQPTVATELYTTTNLKFTITGTDGFSGTGAVTASVVDDAGAPLTGWTVTAATSSVNISTAATDVNVEVKIPSDSKLLTGKVKLSVNAGSKVHDVTSSITALNQVTFKVNQTNGQCTYDLAVLGNAATPVKMLIGSKVRFVNISNGNMEVHSNGSNGVPHQKQGGDATPTLQKDQAYEKTLTAPAGGNVQWYCHLPGPTPVAANRPTITVVAP